jgi:hypothetical protein
MQEAKQYSEFFPDISLDDLPRFARCILTDKQITSKEKRKFVRKVLIPYFTDENMKREWSEKYLYFVDRKLYAIADEYYSRTIHDELPGIPGSKIVKMLISENPPKVYMLPVAQYTYNLTGTALVKVDTFFYYDGAQIRDSLLRLVDTGSTYSTIPFIECWNYETLSYNSVSLSRKYAFNPENLNNNIDDVSDLELETGNGKCDYMQVLWREPLLFSIEDLPPVKVYKMIVKKEEPRRDDITKILGFDIISKHTMIISSRDMRVDIKFLPSEQIKILNSKK